MMARPGGRAKVLAGCAVSVALLLSGTAASAQPPPDPAGYQLEIDHPDQLAALAGTARLEVDVTLLTGDQVRIGLGPDGAPVVRHVDAAPRADGTDVAFHTITRDDRTYLLPSDALSLVGAGVLDLELFNLAKLAALTLDGTVDAVPVIVTHRSQAAARSAPRLAGATVDRTLPSINGTSLTVAGDGQWWQQLASDTPSGVEKVWLNELATVQLDVSVPMVEAPAAWAAGYDGTGATVVVLDTGIDATHPDLAGQVVAEADFTGNPAGATDGHGHGTHVASTIAGTGAASDGLRRGVAPGAKLAIGKVCNDRGSCEFDDIIAGMEWAATTGAKVVNMSLGAPPTDGTDPLSTAVNQLSQATGILFVIAAGNSGPGRQTIASPGAADEALTVGAVNDDGEMANFSGRGPRLGDGAAKPDIVAPGVGIVAARAAGTTMGPVVDEYYVSANGTSMATPHVAGAAAIMAQRYPELSGRELKALLIDSATDLGHDLYAQGEGLLDVAAGVDRTVASSGPVTFGRLPYPHQPVTRTTSYTNLTDQPVTVSVTATLQSENGTPAPDGLITVEPATVTLAPEGTAEVTLTLDGRLLGEDGLFGRYRGTLTATDDTGTVRATDRISALLEAERFETDIEITAPADASSVAYGGMVVIPMDEQTHLHDGPIALDGAANQTLALYAGAYAVMTAVGWRDEDGRSNTALVSQPEVIVDGPTTVTFDLRGVEPVRVETPEPTETYSATFEHRATSETGDWAVEGRLSAVYAAEEARWWTLPTEPVSHGTFRYVHARALVPPLVTMRAQGGGPPIELTPRYVTADLAADPQPQQWGEEWDETRYVVPLVPRLSGRGSLPVVYAGTGSPVELAQTDVDGALVLLTPTDICTPDCAYPALRDRVDDVAELGGAGVIVAGESGRVSLGTPSTDPVQCPEGEASCPAPEPYSAIPVVSVPAEAAAALIDRLDRPGRVQIRLGGEPAVPRVYAVSYVDDQVPAGLPHRVRDSELDRVEHRIHGTQPGMLNAEGLQWARAVPALPRESEPAIGLPHVATGRTITMLVGPRQEEALDRFRLGTVYFDAPYLITRPDHLRNLAFWSWPAEIQEVVVDRSTTLTWNSGPILPGTHTGDHTDSGFGTDWGFCAGCREGDRLWPVMSLTGSTGGVKDRIIGMVNDTGAGFWMFLGIGCDPPACTITLYDEAGNEIPQQLIPVGFVIGSAKEAW